MLKRERYEQRSSKRRRVLTMEYEGQEDWQSKFQCFITLFLLTKTSLCVNSGE